MSDLLSAAKKALPGLEWQEEKRGPVFSVVAEVDFWTHVVIYPGVRYAFHLQFEGHRTVHANLDALFAHLLPQVTARRDALNAALGDGWVPVGERLPEPSVTHVLATDGRIVRTAFHNKSLSCWTCLGGGTFSDVTHWMPLPQPPKETL